MTQTRQMKELLNVCALQGIDSELLKRRVQTLLKYRQKGFAYRGYVEREFWMKTKKEYLNSLKESLHHLYDLLIEENKLEKDLRLLSGAGILDELIEVAISDAVKRSGSVGEKYYVPILNMRYNGDEKSWWWAVQTKVGRSDSMVYERNNEMLISVGLIFYLDLYGYYVRKIQALENETDPDTVISKIETVSESLTDI